LSIRSKALQKATKWTHTQSQVDREVPFWDALTQERHGLEEPAFLESVQDCPIAPPPTYVAIDDQLEFNLKDKHLICTALTDDQRSEPFFFGLEQGLREATSACYCNGLVKARFVDNPNLDGFGQSQVMNGLMNSAGVVPVGGLEPMSMSSQRLRLVPGRAPLLTWRHSVTKKFGPNVIEVCDSQ